MQESKGERNYIEELTRNSMRGMAHNILQHFAPRDIHLSKNLVHGSCWGINSICALRQLYCATAPNKAVEVLPGYQLTSGIWRYKLQ